MSKYLTDKQLDKMFGKKSAAWFKEKLQMAALSTECAAVTDQELRANAALIAAAPDMLEALRAVLVCPHLQIPLDVFKLVSAAVAKAEGRS